MDSTAIINLVNSVTQKWARQRKSEERNASRQFRRRQAMARCTRVTLKEAAFAVMQEAYLKASSGGRLPAHARQIMYAARGQIQHQTGERLDDKYFTQTLLPEYLRIHRRDTADWDVVFDARGHFREPHTGYVVPLGTLDVRRYLNGLVGDCESPLAVRVSSLYPTHGPANRFGAILFIEKEGFLPVLERTRLAERYDLAIMSTKGLSVTAARLLVDRLCGEHTIPLLVLHDFDKAGFSILGTMQRDTDRYTFQNRIRIVDLGLRLEDVEEYGLEAEECHLKGDRRAVHANLLKNGASRAEADFITGGRRVELNAFGSAELIAWIESKLMAHGIGKIIPEEITLTTAFRRAVEADYLRAHADELLHAAWQYAEQVKVPVALAGQIRDALGNRPADTWDRVVAAAARTHVEQLQPPALGRQSGKAQ